MKTIFITGCSSGFGLEIARYFLEEGWRVVATMRTPRTDLLPPVPNLQVIALDVRDPDSIRAAVAAAGPIDVLVNNAGIGWLNAVEGTPLDIARDVFETNTFGTIAVTQAVLPQFRERSGGTIVNITSSVTLKPPALLSVYTASKAAIDAFSESMAIELAPFNTQVKIVMPGRAPYTSFGESAQALIQAQGGFPDAYAATVANVFDGWAEASEITTLSDVAEAVWRAVTDPSCPMRIAAGADAVVLAGSARI